MNLQCDLLEQVRQVLQNENIETHDNLIEFGLHSLIVMELVDAFSEQYNKEFSYIDFVTEPNVDSWLQIIQHEIEGAKNPTNMTSEEAVSDNGSASSQSIIENKYATSDNEEYELSNMQYAYWVGRQSEGMSAHIYLEFDSPTLRIGHLKTSVLELIQQHPMLTIQVSNQGKQSFANFYHPDNVIHVDDLTKQSAAEIQAFLKEKRRTFAHQKLNISQGQVFAISVSVLPHHKTYLHIDVDMISVDPVTLLTALEHLSTVYNSYNIHNNNSPHHNELSPPWHQADAKPTAYFDYLNEKKHNAIHSTKVEADKRWWQGRLDTIAPIPQLPRIAEGLRGEVIETNSLCHTLSAQETESLHAFAVSQSLGMSEILLTLFGLSIGRWSTNNYFRLNYPLFNKPDALKNVIGEFSEFTLLNIALSGQQSLIETYEQIHNELSAIKEHTAYSGIHVLRDLSDFTHQHEISPIVFSSLLESKEIFSKNFQKTFGEPVYCVSQGPKVDLDAQIAYLNSRLVINWDIRHDAFKGNSATDMFNYYIHAIKAFVAGTIKTDDALTDVFHTLDTHLATSNSIKSIISPPLPHIPIYNKLGLTCPAWVIGTLATQEPLTTQRSETPSNTDHNMRQVHRKSDLAYYDDTFEIQQYTSYHSYIERQGCFIPTQIIADKIRRLDGIANVCVCYHAEKLFAFLIADSTPTLLINNYITEQLVEMLPSYLMPHFYQTVDEFPVSDSYKVDVDRLLSSYLSSNQLQEKAQFNSAVEHVIVYIASKIIGLAMSEIAATDDFFDIGGDSLTATHFVNAINQYFQNANLTIVDIFIQRTASNLGSLVEEKKPETAMPIATAFLSVIEGELV